LLTIEAYSRYPAVRLYLGDKLLGEKPTTREQKFRTEFSVPYSSGKLRAVGVDEGKEVESRELVTAGPAHAIRMSPDRKAIHADGQDLSFVTIEIVDDKGTVCTDFHEYVDFRLQGPGTLQAIGNGDLTSRESYVAKPRKVYQGRALVVIRSAKHDGTIKLTAQSLGLSSETVEIETKNPAP
jgi:beta-galactosidase